MVLVACREGGGQVSEEEYFCPHCGLYNKKRPGFLWRLVKDGLTFMLKILLVLAIIISFARLYVTIKSGGNPAPVPERAGNR